MVLLPHQPSSASTHPCAVSARSLLCFCIAALAIRGSGTRGGDIGGIFDQTPLAHLTPEDHVHEGNLLT